MGDEYDLDAALKTAADRFREKLAKDPSELPRRLARRGKATLTRPVREWCLAVCACDLRITSATAITDPSDALGPTLSPRTRAALGTGATMDDLGLRNQLRVARPPRMPHTVYLDSRLLRLLCRPVHIPFPGLPADEVAEMLGTHRGTIRDMVRRGHLEVTYHKGLGGRRGRPVPVVYARRYLDPCFLQSFRMGDPLWGTGTRFLADHVPDDIEQAVQRIGRDSGGGERPVTRWSWVCPSCGRSSGTLFYPLPAIDPIRIRIPEALFGQFKSELLGTGDPAASRSSFACRRCHRVQYPSWVAAESWNVFIGQLTGGLLYGYEVQRPPGLPTTVEECRQQPVDAADAHAKTVIRKRRFRQCRDPMTPRRREVLKLVLQNRTYDEIAAALHSNTCVIASDIRTIWRAHGVKSTGELAEKLGVERRPHMCPRRREVYGLLLTNLSMKQIARRLETTPGAIYSLAHLIYKQFGVSGRGARKRLKEKAGVEGCKGKQVILKMNPRPTKCTKRTKKAHSLRG